MTTTTTYGRGAVLNLSEYMGNKSVRADSDQLTSQPKVMGERHAPVSHKDFADAIVTELKKQGLKSRQTAHSINKGNIYFGMTEIASTSRTCVPVVAWRAAHNQRISAYIFVGAGLPNHNVIALTEELYVFSRQTLNFEERLPWVVENALEEIKTVAKRQQHMFAEFKRISITDNEAEHAIIDMIREEILPPSRAGQVIELWDRPDDKSVRKSRNVWRLFLAVANSYKPRGDTDAVGSLINRSPRLMAYCKGIVLDKL